MHPAVVVKGLGVWFAANFTLADHVCNICKTCFIQMHDLRRIRQHLTDEAATLAANALMSSGLDYCNFLFRSLPNFKIRKLQCIQNTLARLVTNCNKHRVSPILKRHHCSPVEFSYIFKTDALVYKFLHSDHPSCLVLFCVCIVYDIVQDTTIQTKGFRRFLNSIHLCMNQKHTLALALLLMLEQFGMIYLMSSVLPISHQFQKKVKILSLHKGLPTLAYNLASLWYWTWQRPGNDDFSIGFWCCALESALAGIRCHKGTE